MRETAKIDHQDVVAVMSGHVEASILLKAMSNESRLMILCHLLGGEKSVTEIGNFIGLSQSAISQHLALLREHNLVATKRIGQSVKYSLEGTKSRAIIEVLYRLFSKPCEGEKKHKQDHLRRCQTP